VRLDLSFAFMSGIATALLLVITRQIAHEPFRRILFYYFFLFWITLLPIVFIEWTPFPPFVWLYIALAAVSMVGAQVSFTKALRHVSAQEVAPLIYTSVIFSGLIDWWVWKNVPSLISIAGMAVICIGSLITMNFNRKKR
jgi:drug/metabolite transporter (DMT)-like permease